ncbi:MAG TPA: 50S ribosomal protein L29 [Aggregatilineales bacterium]|nr:50S ribosomal protein L29 [Aggregatilineales bacterium]
MKPSDVRNMSEGEIAGEVEKRRQELLDLRIQSAIGQTTNTRRIRVAKREIALLLTIANQRDEEAR